MKAVDFSQYVTDAHSYGGSDAKRSNYMDGKYYMVKLPNDRDFYFARCM